MNDLHEDLDEHGLYNVEQGASDDQYFVQSEKDGSEYMVKVNDGEVQEVQSLDGSPAPEGLDTVVEQGLSE